MMASLALNESFIAHFSTWLLASVYPWLTARCVVFVFLGLVASVWICATGVSRMRRDRCKYMMVGCSSPPAVAAFALARQCRISRQSHALLRHFDNIELDGGQVSVDALWWASRVWMVALGIQFASWVRLWLMTSLVLRQMLWMIKIVLNSLRLSGSRFSMYNVSTAASSVTRGGDCQFADLVYGPSTITCNIPDDFCSAITFSADGYSHI